MRGSSAAPTASHAELRIAVVGGSIAGSAVAVGLLGLGHDVVVFERSPDLRSRGAGVITPAEVLEQLTAAGVLGSEMPRSPASVIRYRGAGPGAPERGAPERGALIGEVEVSLAGVEWADLYADLQARVPPGRYRTGRAVTGVDDPHGAAPSLRLDDGSREGPFDLVVFADGYRSLGRAVVDPDAELAYQGVVFWRGLVDETDVDLIQLRGVVTRVVDSRGHGVLYLIPSRGGSSRGAMWGWYLSVPASDLEALLADDRGEGHRSSTPLGRVRPEVRDRFVAELQKRQVPARHLDVVRSTAQTSVQAVESVRVVRHAAGRVVLVGDAGSVFPPFAGSGVVKAVGNALSLVTAISSGDDLDVSLGTWADGQLALDAFLADQSDRNGRLLVFEVPEPSSLSGDPALAWLHELHPGQPVCPPRSRAVGSGG